MIVIQEKVSEKKIEKEKAEVGNPTSAFLMITQVS